MLTNLVDNAVKYTPPGGVVRIELARSGDRAQLRVADTGPGIPAEDRSRVLQRFTRLDRARSQPGNGLGLALVNAVTLQHHGRLTLGDNAPGLVVTVELPALAAPRARSRARRRPEQLAPSSIHRLVSAAPKTARQRAAHRAAQGARVLRHRTCIPSLRREVLPDADATGVFRLVDGVDRRLRGRHGGSRAFAQPVAVDDSYSTPQGTPLTVR